MPRAPKRCDKVGCPNTDPCSVHPKGWGAKKPGSEMPDGWSATVRIVKARDRHCVLCGSTGHSVDHVIPRSQGGHHGLDNLRLLCFRCHKTKSDGEKNAWRTKS